MLGTKQRYLTWTKLSGLFLSPEKYVGHYKAKIKYLDCGSFSNPSPFEVSKMSRFHFLKGGGNISKGKHTGIKKFKKCLFMKLSGYILFIESTPI